MSHKNEFYRAVKDQKGMSILEILVALTLLGIMGTFVAQKVNESLQEGRVESAKIQIRKIAERLKDFKRKCNFYPSSDQGLEALLEKPTSGRECKKYPPSGFIDANNVPEDPWGNPFIYESDGRKYSIISLGADEEEGGEEVTGEEGDDRREHDEERETGDEKDMEDASTYLLTSL